MNPLILMGAIVGIPVVLVSLFRAKAALVFMALCAGSVLSTFVSDSALDMVQTFVKSYSSTTGAIILIGMLVLPALLTILFLRGTVSGAKWLLNLFPAVLTGLMTLYLVVPLLPPGTGNAITGTTIWDQLVQYQAIVVSIAVGMSVVQLWAGSRSARRKKSKHGK